MSARNPIKCPICAKSNRVSDLRKLSREDLAKLCARRSSETSRAKIWRYFDAKIWRSFALNAKCPVLRVRNAKCEMRNVVVVVHNRVVLLSALDSTAY